MLVLTRKQGQSITIQLKPDVDPKTPVGELFTDGPIEVCILTTHGTHTRVGIKADPRFLILRDELSATARPDGDA